MTNASFEGGCSCGRIRYCAEGRGHEPLLLPAAVVHAGAIRRVGDLWKGSLPDHGWELATRRSSVGVVRGFCSACGPLLTYEHARRPGQVDLTLASLDDPALLRPEYHIWVSHRLPWVVLGDGLPQYPEWRGAGS